MEWKEVCCVIPIGSFVWFVDTKFWHVFLKGISIFERRRKCLVCIPHSFEPAYLFAALAPCQVSGAC